jgi:hypothetical protein
MVWCIEHADSGDEVIECLAESLSILEVSRHTKNPRLYKHKKKFSKKICMCPSCARLLTPLIASDPCRKKDSSIVPDIGHPAQLHRQGDPQRLLLQNRFPGEKMFFFFIINF